MRALLAVLLTLVLAFGLWVMLTASPIDAAAWQPPDDRGLNGPFAPNQALRSSLLLGKNRLQGGEDVAVDRQGRVYAGTDDGRIVRIYDDGAVETFATTGGRPLGLHFDRRGRLWVADASKGLLSITPDGGVTTRLTEVDGKPLRFSNDLDIASDGVVYFTDSSRFSQPEYMLDAFEGRPNGRFIRFDPATRTAEVLMDGLYFANGVALSREEDYVLVNETWRYRVQRYWLKGSQAGTRELFVDNLPGFPDGIATDAEGNFWLALPTVRSKVLDQMHPHPWLKEIVARLPWLHPTPVRYGLVARLDEYGNVAESLHDPGGEVVWEITSVQPAADGLYFGNLHNDWVAQYPR